MLSSKISNKLFDPLSKQLYVHGFSVNGRNCRGFNYLYITSNNYLYFTTH